ncbi:MAG: MoaD/ThiS family protein [Candidatus Melainabacteria bacterium]|nr:MoaD/ThiS family protein [Candidatus Melainabacteria bacterium]
MNTVPKTIHIQYFALMREERGLSKESYATDASNAQELFAELKQKYNFSLDSDRLRVSINDQFEDWNHALSENDSVVFIPPVAGG